VSSSTTTIAPAAISHHAHIDIAPTLPGHRCFSCRPASA
jgi:hypothetical protein